MVPMPMAMLNSASTPAPLLDVDSYCVTGGEPAQPIANVADQRAFRDQFGVTVSSEWRLLRSSVWRLPDSDGNARRCKGISNRHTGGREANHRDGAVGRRNSKSGIPTPLHRMTARVRVPIRTGAASAVPMTAAIRGAGL
jgi:hypothetical protein